MNKTELRKKLKKLKRSYAKVSRHAELTEEAIDLKCEIDSIERQLKS